MSAEVQLGIELGVDALELLRDENSLVMPRDDDEFEDAVEQLADDETVFEESPRSKAAVHIANILLTRMNKSPDKYHPTDFEQLRTNCHLFLHYYLNHLYREGKPDSIYTAVDTILECLEWRVRERLHDMRPRDLPREIYSTDFWSGFERPDTETVTICINVRRIQKQRAFTTAYIHLIAVNILKLLSRLGNRQVHLILDTAHISLSHVDMGVHIVYAILYYFPGVVQATYITNLPFILRAGVMILLRAFPERMRSRIHIVENDFVLDKVGREYLPPDMGGTCNQMEFISSYCPDDAVSLEEYAKSHGISKSNVKKFLDHVNQLN